MAFSNYRTTALMLFYVAFAASGVEAEVIRQHLTVGKNENAMALTAAEGADQDRRFWCFMGRGVRRHANFALALANSGLDSLSSALGAPIRFVTAGTPGQRRFQAQRQQSCVGLRPRSRRFARLLTWRGRRHYQRPRSPRPNGPSTPTARLAWKLRRNGLVRVRPRNREPSTPAGQSGRTRSLSG
jgi:hypothetical protein